MPSRRLHPKTRHGCPQCKARRVKVGRLGLDGLVFPLPAQPIAPSLAIILSCVVLLYVSRCWDHSRLTLRSVMRRDRSVATASDTVRNATLRKWNIQRLLQIKVVFRTLALHPKRTSVNGCGFLPYRRHDRQYPEGPCPRRLRTTSANYHYRVYPISIHMILRSSIITPPIHQPRCLIEIRYSSRGEWRYLKRPSLIAF